MHNGEIYNYRELRRELEGARPSLPLADRHRGDRPRVRGVGRRLRAQASTGCGRSRSGTAARQRLFCSRDRFGVKPFYYSLGRRAARVRERAEGVPRRRARSSRTCPRCATTSSRATSTTRTTRSSPGIRKLPPAHSLVVDERGLRARAATGSSSRATSDGDSADAVRELFLDAVRLRLRSDVPVGTCLSGGIDSSAIVCAVDHLLRTEAENARPVGDRQRTFTAFFEERGFDERPFARGGRRRRRARSRTGSRSTRDELVDVLPSIVRDAGRAVRLDVDRRAVVRDARGEGGRAEGDARRPGRRRDARRLPRLLRAVLRRPARAAGSCASSARSCARTAALHGAGVGATAVALARPFLPERVRWARARPRRAAARALVHPDLPLAPPTPHANGFDGGYLRRQMQLILTRARPARAPAL